MSSHRSDMWEQLALFDDPQLIPVVCERCGEVEPNACIRRINHGDIKADRRYCFRQQRAIWRLQAALRNPCLEYAVQSRIDEARALRLTEKDWETTCD